MIRWAPVLWLIALIVASALFAAFPAIDLAVSGFFFDGTGFPVEANRGIEAVRLALYAAEDLGSVVALGLTLVTGCRGIAVLRLGVRDWFFGFSVFALGPGLLVNILLKRIWGRARPYRVTEFGGPFHFTPPWQISDQCLANCSFVSGEMAGAVALTVLLAMVLRANTLEATAHRLAWSIVCALPLFTAWQRVAAGRHFLSDVVLSALLVALLASILARLFYPVNAGSSPVDIHPSTP